MLTICLAPKMLLGEKESVNYLMDHFRLAYNLGNHPRYMEFTYGPSCNRVQVYNDFLDAMIKKKKKEKWEIPIEELKAAAERQAEEVT
ncbi:predicted protein [Chaetoceros tenuissimus]|uniref:Uncharacterized protein n=1 Tax=Chaetoceros tenuissimus TaxID=426638 RepID=A0AAD3CHH0_9STRA|nr:predicted protein [Chaetoceros tenuissimus]